MKRYIHLVIKQSLFTILGNIYWTVKCVVCTKKTRYIIIKISDNDNLEVAFIRPAQKVIKYYEAIILVIIINYKLYFSGHSSILCFFTNYFLHTRL